MAGCWNVMYGVESGSQKILDSISKGFTIQQIISAFEITKKIGLTTLCSFIYGLPGETKETLQESFELAKKIKPNFFAGGPLKVYPGSRIYKLIQSGNYPGRVRNLKKDEKIVAAFFNRGNYTVLEDNMTFEEMIAIAKKATREFYLRPQYIWQSLIDIRSFSDFRYYLKGGIEIMKLIIK